MDLCMVLAKIFRVQYTEVALLRLEGGLLRFIFPDYLRTTGAIPLSSKAVAAHTALSKKAEIFNNFARVKHASIFETIKPDSERLGRTRAAGSDSEAHVGADYGPRFVVVGVIQISRKGLDPKFRAGFQPRRLARSGTGRRITGHRSRVACKLISAEKIKGTLGSERPFFFSFLAGILQEHPQVGSGHLFRLVKAEHPEHGR